MQSGMATTLWIGLVISLATATLFVACGALVQRRPASDDARLAMRMYATWWYAVGAVIGITALRTLLALAGVTAAPVYETLTFGLAFPLAVSLWSLLYYLAYIYTGRRAAIVPLSVAYAAFLVFTLYYFSRFEGRHLVTTAWSVNYAATVQPPRWMDLVFGVSLAVPILAVVVGYGMLYFRVEDKAGRRRVRSVSLAFGVWFGAVLLGYLLGWQRRDWFPLIYELPGLFAAGLVAATYWRARDGHAPT